MADGDRGGERATLATMSEVVAYARARGVTNIVARIGERALEWTAIAQASRAVGVGRGDSPDAAAIDALRQLGVFG